MSDSKITYVIFSPQPWNSQHSRTRSFAIELSRLGYHTIYVNPPNSLAGIVRESVATVVYPLRRENVNFQNNFEMLEVWSPPILPTFYRGSLIPGFDRWLFKAWFDKRIKGIKNPIIAIIAMPYWWDGYLNDHIQNFAVTVFDYQDPIGIYARTARIHQHMSEVFTELVIQVNGVIAHTETNYKNILAHRKPSEVCLIRNAGNGASARRQSTSNNTGLSGHPVIGTIGRISQNIDITLLLELADHFPNGKVVNIGTVTEHGRLLKSKKNIVLMAPMSQDELHSEINNFNVGILPYHQSIEGSPLRIYDLLSASIQVVSTNFPDAQYFRDVVHITSSHNEFISKIKEVLFDKSKWIDRNIIEVFLRHNTWSQSVSALVAFCERLRDRK